MYCLRLNNFIPDTYKNLVCLKHVMTKSLFASKVSRFILVLIYVGLKYNNLFGN